VPLATLAFQLRDGVTAHETRQLLGNLLLLLPLGVYGPALWRPMRSAAVVLVVAASVSALIELGQLGLAASYGFPVRVADVDDILLNTLGAVLGWAVWSGVGSRPIESCRHAVRPASDR
jgi:glycopeptide antibiotics resistance protein